MTKNRTWGAEVEFFLCECETPSHQMLMRLYDWGEDSPKSLSMPPSSNVDLSIDVFLNSNRGFFGRLWYGLKYIFGCQSKYGAFEGVDVEYKDVDRMVAILRKYKERVEHYREVMKHDLDSSANPVEEDDDDTVESVALRCPYTGETATDCSEEETSSSE